MDNEFEKFMSLEVPKRISTEQDPSNVAKGLIPVSTGVGLGVELKTVEEIVPFSLDGARPGIGYIETFISQIGYPGVPVNLSSEQANGGIGPAPVKNWVGVISSGKLGENVITCEQSTSVIGAGNTQWPCILENTDGTFTVNLVTGDDGKGVFTLANPLNKIPSRLSSRWDMAQGQHMTITGTKAYAEHVYNQLTNVCVAEKMIGPWLGVLQPPVHQGLWGMNSVSNAYGRVVINNVATELLPETYEGNPAFNGRLTRVSREPGQITAGVHLPGHGVMGTWQTSGQKGVIEIYTCTRASSATLESRGKAKLKIIGILNKTEYVLKEVDLNDQMQRVISPFSGFDSISCKIESSENYPFFIVICESICWITEASSSKLINKDVKVVVFGDSWFEYYEGGFGKHLESLMKKDGGKGVVINRGKAGMTTRYALDWLEKHVLSEPGVQQCIFHFFTNDLNNLGNATYKDPNGTDKPLNVNDRYELVANLRKLAARCEEAGIQPIIIMPSGKASASGTTDQQRATALLRRPVYTDRPPPIKLSELNDQTSHINNYGKRLGKQVINGSDILLAQGSLSNDPWVNQQNNRITLLESLSLPIIPFDVSKHQIGIDSNSDGLSDGITLTPFGINTGTTAVFSIENDIQKQTMTYTAEGSTGNTRMEFSTLATSGNRYAVIVEFANGDPSLSFDAVMRNTSGTVTPVPELFDGKDGSVLNTSTRILDSNGNKTIFFYHSALDNKPVGVLVAPSGPRTVLPSVQKLGIKRVNIIDLTAFSNNTGVNIAGYSGFDLFNLLNSAIKNTPPSFITLTDSVTGKPVKVSVSNGVLKVI